MRHKQYHNRAFALGIAAIVFLSVTFSLPAQSLAERDFSRGVADSLSLSGMTTISFSERVLLHDLRMSVATLDSASVPPMDYGMTNVTVQGEGCRFLPHGTHFGGEGATVRLRYDRTRIPSGYTEEDIRTYYYDTSLERWVALERVEVDRGTATVVSRTTHFTDMVNGVIVAPETPETGAFVPTMMTDIQAADPTSKLTFIAPPTANNRGSANLQYPLEMPPARNGMQPSLTLTYDSDGGNGWAGEGWDIRVPAITVDTRWGVPRYSTEFESETYLLNGQMLAMMNGNQMTVAHRQDSIPRQSERQFFVRQGGDFSKIVRHGDSPGNYWWQVTSRDGTVYTYGVADSSCVKGNYIGVDGIQREVIAEWRLNSVRETHGDRIDYIWQADTIYLYGGTFAVRDLWLSQVTAKNKEHAGPHTRVTFHNREQGKAMSANSARYGFLTAATHLLKSVDVDFRAGGTGSFETLRTYALAYENGKFGRERLLQLDHIVSNDTVSFQKFKYYDDATEISNSLSTFAVDADSIKGGDGNSSAFLPHKIGDIELRSVPSALGGTFSRNYSGSLYAGVGYGTSPGKTLTGGLALGYGQSNSTGEATLVDLDGDGLPDKVRKTNNGLEYCRQTLTDGVATFDNPVPVQTNGVSLSNFSRSKTSTTTIGGKGYVGVYSFTIEGGVDWMTSTSRTTHYFADVNGDGLVDLVNNGHVYFNHIVYGSDGKPRPTFTNTSVDTPSPINNNGAISTVVLDAITEDMDTLVESSPMQDVVRYWVAPMDGTVCIDGTVTRQQPSGIYDQEEYAQADSLHVAIEHGGSEIWGRSIAKDDATSYTHSVSNVNVYAGDRIFFRLQCGRQQYSDGSFDKVVWPVSVSYVTDNLLDSEPNGHSLHFYSPEEDNVPLVGTELPADTASITIFNTYSKPATSDDVTLTIRYTGHTALAQPTYGEWTREASDTTAVWSMTLGRLQEVAAENVPLAVPAVFNDGVFSFEVSSTSNVRWEDVSWRPSLRYVHDLGTRLDTSIVAANPQYKIFNKLVKAGTMFTNGNTPVTSITVTLSVTPHMRSGSYEVLTLKNCNDLIAKIPLSQPFSQHTYAVDIPAGESVCAEFFADYQISPSQINAATVQFGQNGPVIPASVYCVDSGGDLGPTHRGWGQFVYNAGGNRYARPIVTDSLSMPRDSASCDPRSMKVTLLTPSNDDPTFLRGGKQDIYIHGDTLSAARLTDNHVLPDSTLYALADTTFTVAGTTLKGTGARGITLVSKSSSTDGIAGVSLAGLSLSGNTAGGNCEIKNAFMDMNGDGYPDIVTEGAIQYTNPYGGFARGGMLDRTALGLAESEERMFSTNEGYNIGFGGSPIFSHSTIRSGETARLSAESATAAVSLTLANSNKSESKMSYIDINGDGLPDLVSRSENGQLWLRLNMGYGFSSRVSLGVSDSIQTTNDKTQTVGLSGSFNIGASSFAGGISAAATKTTVLCAFIDVNGDGLPDKVYDDRGTLKVRQNLGDAFATAIVWNGLDSLERHGATSRSENVAFTYSFTITPPGIKIAISPSFVTGKSMSQPQLELRDIDGDGFIDILESDGENDLRVRRSTIRRTNRLRSVTNSLGGKFEIDYEHSTPTYGLPGGKWVMSSVTVDRGIHGNDYDIPNTRQTFDYANGVRDRHEREFLGFHEVTTWQVDPGNGNAPLRQTVEVYDTASVYTAGSLLLTYVADPQGNRYGETRNTYYTYALTNDCDNSAYNGGRFSFDKDAFSRRNDRGAAYCPLCFSERRQYEGGRTAAVLTQDWYQYYDRTGDHGLLRKYRHCVGGGLTESGGGTYNYQTNIEYNYNLSDTAYIIGMPKRVKVTDKRESLYHLTEATYDRGHPNQITQIKRMLTTDAWVPAGPIGRGDGTGAGTNAVVDGIGGGVITPFGRYNPDQEPRTDVEDYHNPVYAVTNYTYDEYGNLLSATLPMGSDSTHVQYQYHHETTQNSYLSGIVDSYGLHSHSGETDYRFGITNKQVDKNGAVSRTANDLLGRLTSVWSPIDSANATPAIKFTYSPKAVVTGGTITTPAHATTVYYFPNTVTDNEVPVNYTDSMRVVTFVDGFGRPIQVRKDGVVWISGRNVDKTIVNGRTDYDGYGRAVHSYHPSTVQVNTVEDYTPGAQKNEFFTTTAHDLLDRETAVTLPDNTTTTYLYGIDGNTATTTAIDAKGHAGRTVTDGDGRTVQSVQYKGGTEAEALTTTFAYDGIGRLTTVTDTEGNVTSSTYDLGDRRTSVTHPASGKATFTYDALGNVLTRQTANLRTKGQCISYTYEQGRLKRVSYPGHPENDVIYHYGDGNAEQGLRGRVKFREDGSGGTEYHYDLLGNVNRMKRTVTVPGNTIATAEMTWTYDNFGKLKQMAFPRANGFSEKVTYHYDRAGQLQKVYNGDLAGYHYVKEIGYDEFGDRVYIKYGNGDRTTYSYYADNRRLYQMVTLSNTRPCIAGRMYNYDKVGNITAVSTISSNLLLPAINHTYRYDALNRLVEAHGRSLDNSNLYGLNMEYDNMYRVTSKHQSIQQQDIQFTGKLFAGYSLDYSYNQTAGKRFQMSTVSDTNYRTAMVAPTAGDSIREAHSYEYDNNGNILYVNTSRVKPDMTTQPDTVQRAREERFRWDEENRLTALSQNGYVSHYWYDANGERTVKMHGGNMAVFVNGRQDGRVLDTQQTTAYFSPYFSIHEGRFTKHLYIGSERIASMTGELKPGDVSNSPAGGYNISHAGYGVDVTQLNIPYAYKCAAMRDSAEANYAHFGLPNALEGQTRQLREFVLPAGGDNEAEAPALRSGDKDNYNGNIWFIHSDHLGSSTLVTDGNGEASQQVEYLPYGEVFLERQNGDFTTPYKFNGKELDEETGLYYYGARYMNPRLSIWYGCDPLQEKYPNISSYTYCHSNPITRLDEDGMDDWEINSFGYVVKRIENKRRDAFFIVNNRGRRISGKLIILPYGTIESATGQRTSSGKAYDVYMLHGDKRSTMLFEFLAQHTTVEWSQIKLGIKGEKGLNFLTTSHGHKEEAGSADLINKQLRFGYTIREDNHSHPENTPYPSGMKDNEADIQYAQDVVKAMGQTPIFRIFLPTKKKYVTFTPYSTPEEFGFRPSVTLNEVEVMGKRPQKK